MSLEPGYRLVEAYLIHTADVRIIGGGIVLRRDENAVALCCSDIDQVCLRGLGVDAINFHDAHSVAFKPEVLTGKTAYVDNTEHVSLSRFH